MAALEGPRDATEGPAGLLNFIDISYVPLGEAIPPKMGSIHQADRSGRAMIDDANGTPSGINVHVRRAHQGFPQRLIRLGGSLKKRIRLPLNQQST
jgi:hypothetical protein